MTNGNDSSTKGKPLSEDEIKAIASDFEKRDFAATELATIRKTRRRSPRLGEARAEVYTFRAPPSYKRRIQDQAKDQGVTESQVIRDALDAYSPRRSSFQGGARVNAPQSRYEPHQCLGPAAQEVRVFADALRVGTAELLPKADCPWHEEIPDLVQAMRLERGATERIMELGQRSAQLLTRSVSDHLYALSNCVDDRTLFSVSSLARIAMEAAAWAAWLNDDMFDARTTLARNVKLQKKSLKAECERLGIAKEHIGSGGLVSHLDGMLTKCTAEIDECAIVIGHLGVVRDSKVPNKTEVVRDMLSRANLPGLAEVSYSHHSSIVHSEPFMLERSLDARGEAHSDLQTGMTVQSKLTPVLQTLRVVSWLVKTTNRWWGYTVDTHRLDEVDNRIYSIGRQFKDEPAETLSE